MNFDEDTHENELDRNELKKLRSAQKKINQFNRTNPDLPGIDTQVRLAENEPNSSPSGLQSADNPTLNPPYHYSPDARASKQFHPSEIEGWGADLDHKNRPGYPKERMPPRPIGVHWTQPEAQIPQVKIFHSVERPGITPVFGSACPPRGLSGYIREHAYRRSENDIRHWLMLMAADRVDVVEGIIEDLSQGHVPNLWKERGMSAELKHRPVRFVAKAALLVGAVGLGVAIFKKRRATRAEQSMPEVMSSTETLVLYTLN